MLSRTPGHEKPLGWAFPAGFGHVPIPQPRGMLSLLIQNTVHDTSGERIEGLSQDVAKDIRQNRNFTKSH